MTRSHRVLVALKLPKAVPMLITRTQSTVEGMTGNPKFSSPTPTLAAVTVACNDFIAAEATANTKVKGAAQTRNQKKKTLELLMEQLGQYVQGVADADPENAEAIILSARFMVRAVKLPAARVFAAARGKLTGSVNLRAPGAGQRTSYEWQYSIDGHTWTLAAVTIQAKTTISNLTVGAMYSFRYKVVSKTGEADWSSVITFVVA